MFLVTKVLCRPHCVQLQRQLHTLQVALPEWLLRDTDKAPLVCNQLSLVHGQSIASLPPTVVSNFYTFLWTSRSAKMVNTRQGKTFEQLFLKWF